MAKKTKESKKLKSSSKIKKKKASDDLFPGTRDKVGRLADKLVKRSNDLENTKSAVNKIQNELLKALHEQKRESITIQDGPYNSVTLKIKYTAAAEKIQIKR